MKSTKTAWWQLPEDAGRMRAAYLRTRDKTGYRSLTEMINAAVMAEVTRLEARYHGGRPWKPVPAGEIGTGRPVEEHVGRS